jgi:hypothetical protein
LFQEAEPECTSLLKDTSRPEDTRRELIECLEHLREAARQNETSLRLTEAELEAHLKSARADLTALKQTAAPATQASAEGRAKVDELARVVASVRTRHSVALAEFESNLVLGQQAGVAGLKLVWPVTGGVLVTGLSRSLLKSVGAAGSGLLLANVMYLWSVAKQFLSSRKLRDESDALVRELEKLSVAEQQWLVTSATADYMVALVDSLAELPLLSASLAMQWKQIHTQLEATLQVLEQPVVAFDKVSGLQSLRPAAARWRTLTELARKIQGNLMEQLDVRVDEIQLRPELTVVA